MINYSASIINELFVFLSLSVFHQMLQVKRLEPSLTSKMQFCTDFIVPRTRNVAKYIALYRKVIREGVSVISTTVHT